MELKLAKDALVEKKREIKPYALLISGSRILLEKGQDDPHGSFWQFLSSLVFSAFALEGYLNQIGPLIIDRWEQDDIGSLGPLEKLDRVCLVLELDMPKGERPYQTAKKLFIVRNELAHPKQITLEMPPQLTTRNKAEDRIAEFLLTQWEEAAKDINFALRARKDIELIVSKIYDACPEPKDHYRSSGVQIGSIRVLND